jgi:hypothetical protein
VRKRAERAEARGPGTSQTTAEALVGQGRPAAESLAKASASSSAAALTEALDHYARILDVHVLDSPEVAAARASLERSIAAAREADRAEIERLRGALGEILSAVRSDEKAQHLDARAWLDARGIYHGDLDGSFADGDPVLEAVARAALAAKETPSHG